MEVEVRLINGESFKLDNLGADHTVSDVKKLLAQRRDSLSSCQIYHNGTIVKGSTLLATLDVQPGKFLVAIQCRPKKTVSSSQRAHEQSEQRIVVEQNDARTSDNHLLQQQHYTLLPGYISRPQPSPQKNKVKPLKKQSIQFRDNGTHDDHTMDQKESISDDEDDSGAMFTPFRFISDPNIICAMPLPPLVLSLESKLRQLSVTYGFLQRSHIQCTYSALKQSLAKYCDISFNELKLMAKVCPHAVHFACQAEDEGLCVVTLSDPWLARHTSPPPRQFIEDYYSKMNPGQKYKKSNKNFRIAWEFRRNIVNVMASMAHCTCCRRNKTQQQDRTTQQFVPYVEHRRINKHVVSQKKRNMRRSKRRRNDDGTCFDDERTTSQWMQQQEQQQEQEEEEEQRIMDEVEYAWHPEFQVDRVVTMDSLYEAAIALENTFQSINPALTGNNNNDINNEFSPKPVKKMMAKKTRRPDRDDRHDNDDNNTTTNNNNTHINIRVKNGDDGDRTHPPAPPQLLKKHPPCADTSPLTAPDFLAHLQSRPGYQGQIVHVQSIPSRPPTFTHLAPEPPLAVQNALRHRGICNLYSHQVDAINSLRNKRHTVVATSTASGKSLCYIVPILEALVSNPSSTAILMYPTKALAQDQLKALREMVAATFSETNSTFCPAVEIYDGDTDMGDRGDIRDRVQILLTNPDMLHCSILPFSHQFARLLANLTYVIIDEGHMYKGVFGCHTALVLRRLRRICSRVYNTNPVFAITTATVANPKQHARTLLGVADTTTRNDDNVDNNDDDIHVVHLDGSPHGGKQFVLWNPPLKQPAPDATKPSNKKPTKSKREVQEARRASLRAARQERNSGQKLGPEIDEDQWTKAVSTGQRDAVVKRKQEEEKKKELSARERKLVAQAAAALSAAHNHENHSNTYGVNNDISGGGDMRGRRSAGIFDDNKYGSNNGGLTPSNLTGTTQLRRRVIHIGPKIDEGAIIPETITYITSTTTTTRGYLQQKAAHRGNNHPSSPHLDNSLHFSSSSNPSRTSPIVEIATLLAEAVQHQLRTIAFCKTRKLSELVVAYVREILAVTAPDLQNKVAVYRSGYSPAERREIEHALFSGNLYGVAATNALELGVDIGGLDCTLHLGFPGSIASLNQQAGRAGRREQPSISIYVAFDGPLDQYFFRHPEKLFGRPVESALVDASNPAAMESHVLCAAFEVPIDLVSDTSPEYFGSGLTKAIVNLQTKGLLGRNLLYTGSLTNPASAITLRAIDPGRYSIVDDKTGRVLEEVEQNKAFYQVYDGGTYFFQGRTYLCRRLDVDARVAIVRQADVKYYTKPVDYTSVQVIGSGESMTTTFSFSAAMHCNATVTTRWLGFVRIWRGTGQVFDTVDLFLPDVEYQTEATYIRLPPAARRKVEEAGLPFREGVHAAAHAVLNALSLFLMANPEDVAAECDNPYDTRYKPERILIYDKHPGGIGLAAAAQPIFGQILKRAYELITSCDCHHGCPGCVQHTDCGEYNSVLHKKAGELILETVVGLDDGTNENFPTPITNSLKMKEV